MINRYCGLSCRRDVFDCAALRVARFYEISLAIEREVATLTALRLKVGGIGSEKAGGKRAEESLRNSLRGE